MGLGAGEGPLRVLGKMDPTPRDLGCGDRLPCSQPQAQTGSSWRGQREGALAHRTGVWLLNQVESSVCFLANFSSLLPYFSRIIEIPRRGSFPHWPARGGGALPLAQAPVITGTPPGPGASSPPTRGSDYISCSLCSSSFSGRGL